MNKKVLELIAQIRMAELKKIELLNRSQKEFLIETGYLEMEKVTSN